MTATMLLISLRVRRVSPRQLRLLLGACFCPAHHFLRVLRCVAASCCARRVMGAGSFFCGGGISAGGVR